LTIFGRIKVPVTLPESLRRYTSSRQLVAIGGLWLFLFFIVPVLILVWESLNLGGTPTIEHYETAISGIYLQVMLRSFLYALISTASCLILGYVVAYYIAFKTDRELLVLTGILLPLWVAIVIRYFGVALFFLPSGPLVQLFGTDFGVMFNMPGVIIGLVGILLPFAILPLYNVLDSLDREMLSASHTLGAGRLRTFYEVTLPQSISGVVAAVVVVFILSAGSFLAPAILGGPANNMFTNLIANSYAFSIELAAAMSVTFMVALLIIILVFNSYVNIGEVLGEL